jgi:Domain of unknown function (DUF4112)
MQQKVPEGLINLKDFSKLMDSRFKIPKTNISFGLDSIIGLIPGVGDLLTTASSSYYILLGISMNMKKTVLLRMFFNLIVDATIGAIPIVGDVFDLYWKANLRNFNLLFNEHQIGNLSQPNLKNVFRFMGIFMIISLLLILLCIYLILKASFNFWFG